MIIKVIFKLYRRNEDQDCIPTNLKKERVVEHMGFVNQATLGTGYADLLG